MTVLFESPETFAASLRETVTVTGFCDSFTVETISSPFLPAILTESIETGLMSKVMLRLPESTVLLLRVSLRTAWKVLAPHASASSGFLNESDSAPNLADSTVATELSPSKSSTSSPGIDFVMLKVAKIPEEKVLSEKTFLFEGNAQEIAGDSVATTIF